MVQLSKAEQRRLLRAALARAGYSRRLELAYIEALGRLAVTGQSGQRVQLPALEVVRVFDRLEFRPRVRPACRPEALAGGLEAARSYEHQVQIPGECLIPATGTRLLFNLVGQGRAEQGYNREEESLADLDSLQNPLTVRNWRPGDRFDSPTGRGSRKVKTLLLERRIPAEQRRLWPVVVSGERILWMRGFPVARAFRMRATSAAGILIREEVLADGEAGSSPE